MNAAFSRAIATPELAFRLRQLADRLDDIRTGQAPTERDLIAAPVLNAWDIVVRPTGAVLVGHVTGHPMLRERVIATSPVWVINIEEGWALTLSRFYRLGRAAFERQCEGGTIQ